MNDCYFYFLEKIFISKTVTFLHHSPDFYLLTSQTFLSPSYACVLCGVSWPFISCCCCCPTFSRVELISHGNSLKPTACISLLHWMNHASDSQPSDAFILQCITLSLSLWFTGIFPGQAEDHRKHGSGYEASKPAAAAGQSQAVDEMLEREQR